MKKILTTILLFVSAYTFAQTSSEDVIIPKGVHYKKANPTLNQAAKKALSEALSSKNGSKLFSSLCYVGPQLWAKYAHYNGLNKIKGGDLDLKVPKLDNNGKTISETSMQGKLIQSDKDFRKLWETICFDLGQNGLTYSKPNPQQLRYYWSVIFYDIEEPIYIVDNGVYKFLFQFTKDLKLGWIDKVE